MGWNIHRDSDDDKKTFVWTRDSADIAYYKPDIVLFSHCPYYISRYYSGDPLYTSEAPQVDKGLAALGIPWIMESYPDLYDPKGSVPKTAAEWQQNRVIYQKLFDDLPNLAGIQMNFWGVSGIGDKGTFIQTMVDEYRTLFETNKKKMLFRFYRFADVGNGRVFDNVNESWVAYYPKEPDGDFSLFRGHGYPIKDYGPSRLVIPEMDTYGEYFNWGRFIWNPVALFRRSRAIANKYDIEGVIARMNFSNTRSQDYIRQPLAEVNIISYQRVMEDTNFTMQEQEIYDVFLERYFGFTPGTELSIRLGRVFSNSYLTLLKAGWTLGFETCNLRADNDWGSAAWTAGTMTSKKAVKILQEKQESWENAESMLEDMLFVKSKVNPSIWQEIEFALYRTILISKSARFEAEARVELARARDAAETPNWATIKYAVDRLKEIPGEWKRVYPSGDGYFNGKYLAAVNAISEIEPQIPEGTQPLLAQGPYLTGIYWNQTLSNKIYWTWESEVSGKSFIEYGEDPDMGDLTESSVYTQRTSSTDDSGRNHTVVLSSLNAGTCYWFRMVTVPDEGDTLRSSYFVYTMLNINPIENKKLSIAKQTSPNYLNIVPNPFSGAANFGFVVPSYQNVSLNVFNPRGELIKILINKKMAQGSYRILWNSNNINSGMYIVNFKSETGSFNSRLYLIK
ncbi:MAG: T9SS type A sorting domain-containing protein [bacterium]